MAICSRLVVAFALVAVASGSRWTEHLRSASDAVQNTTASLFHHQHTNNESRPSFCHERPCPAFTTLQNSTSYAIRKYQSATWVTTHINSSSVQYALARGAVPLHRYLRGVNNKSVELPLGSPLALTISASVNYTHLPTGYTLALYLDNTTVADAPKPKDSNLGIYSSPEGEVYVYTFSGFATGKSILGNARKLAAALTQDGVKFDASTFMLAVYDGPTRLTSRHNEIWFMPETSGLGSIASALTTTGVTA